MLIGYARVSTIEQNLDRQLGALVAQGCSKIFSEKASGKSTHNRPELEKAINALGTGDVLLVAEWDRATRSMHDGIAIMQRVASRGALIKALDRSYIDLTTTLGQGILAFLSAIAQDERERIIGRSNSGRKAAVIRGVKFGPKYKLTPLQKNEAARMLDEGRSLREVSLYFNVHRNTIFNLKKRVKA